jgi:hypothetical protein
MSISKKQLEANRENAKKGGVKTEKGKLKSKLNAIKHGMLLTKEILLPGEDVSEFVEFRNNIMDELLPNGQLELTIVDRLISSFWRLRRALRMETSLIMEQLPEGLPSKDSGQQVFEICYAEKTFLIMDGLYIDTLMRYEATIERQWYKALDKIIEVRKIRDKLANTPGSAPLDRRLPPTPLYIGGNV